MLVIRMQRTGRKGHAMFRVVVQDSRRTPTSGKVVASLGSYDPHAKVANINKEKVEFYLEHGAQPSDRMARLLKKEGVKLPKWVKLEGDKERTVRNSDKRRSTRPEEPKEEAPEAPAEEAPTEEAATEAPKQETPAEEPAKEEAPVEEKAEESKPEEAEAEKPAETKETKETEEAKEEAKNE